MYVIATVICPNFHFSVSPHVPFLNLLFEQIANSNEYLLAKFQFAKIRKFQLDNLVDVDTSQRVSSQLLFEPIPAV